MALFDTDGDVWAELTAGGLRWFDAEGVGRLALALNADGAPSVVMRDPDGRPCATLTADESEVA